MNATRHGGPYPPPPMWFINKPGLSPSLRLFCFSYAGGSAASFLSWQTLVGPQIEICAVQLPGRGTRLREAPSSSLPSLVREISLAIEQKDQLPFAFFGHSLGSLLAFEVARYCAWRGQRQPLHLFVSGCAAPQHRSPPQGLHLLGDEELLDVLRRYNGTPAEILSNRDLMELALPIIRADFALVDGYTYSAAPRLQMPISAMGGKADEGVTPEQLASWASETTRDCKVTMYEGGHFFINDVAQQVVDQINATLNDALRTDTVPARVKRFAVDEPSPT